MTFKIIFIRPILFFVLILVTSGCAGQNNKFKEEILNDGKTWKITVIGGQQCNALTSDDECLNKMRPEIEKKAIEICTQKVDRIFSCSHREAWLHETHCLVRCKEEPAAPK